MANKYFNFYNENTNEHSLFNNLADEMIEMYGIDTYYMSRQNRKEDYLFGDAIGSQFTEDNSFHISMYLENPLDMVGDENFSKFGLQIQNQAIFLVQQQRIHQSIGNRPYTGDLIYCPTVLKNRIFEVYEAEEKANLYSFGKLSIYKITCNLLEISDETFETPYSELNSLNDTTSISTKFTDNISATTATIHIDFSERNPWNA